MVPLLVLTGTVLAWAALDAMRKRLAARVAPVPLAIVLAVGTFPLFLVAMAFEGVVIPELPYWGWALAAGAVNIVGAVLLLEALRVAPLSVVIPLLALSPVVSALLGMVILGEIPELRQWAGMGLVLLGAIVLGATGDGRANLRGLVMGVVVACAFATTVVLDKAALVYVNVAQHGLFTVALLAGSLLVWLAARGQLRTFTGLRDEIPWLAGASVTLAASLALQLWAVQLWLVSVVEGAKRAIGMSMAVVLGRLLFGEALTPGKVVAVVLMILGVLVLV